MDQIKETMWNKISRYAMWAMTGVLLLFSSCKKDYDSYYIGVSYGNVVGNTGAYTIKTDEGMTLYIVENGCPGTEVTDGERIMANYTILEQVEMGYNVRLNFLQNILTKNPVYLSQMTPAQQEELGNDPVNVLGMNFGGKYLNVNLEILRKDPALAHSINLAVDEQRSDDKTVYLTLRHNAYGDAASVATSQRVSFDLSGLVPEGQRQITVYVDWTNYQGMERQDSGILPCRPVISFR